MKYFVVSIILCLQTHVVFMQSGREISDSQWGTHMPVMLTAALNTDGPIVEFGSSDFSTPLLHAVCSRSHRLLTTVEAKPDHRLLFNDLNTDWHVITDKLETNGNRFAVVVINNAAYKKAANILKSYKADIFVIQASRAIIDSLYSDTQFQYKYIYDRYATRTLVLSDIIDVGLLLETHKKESQKNRLLGDGNWGTHCAPLATVMMNTDGPVLEMGSGDFSTPLLHAVCAKNKRQLLTADMMNDWLGLFTDLTTSFHTFEAVPLYWVDSWESPPWDKVGVNQLWDVVFVDHSPGKRRIADVIRLRPYTNIFVVHDTQSRDYEYEPTLSSFKYKYVYTRYAVQTTIVSDKIDVSKFFVH